MPKLRVCHYCQIPCKPFIVKVDNEKEAYLVEQALTNQHLFLYENNIIPDYCNAITVDMLVDNEWENFEKDELDWDQYKEEHFNK